MSVNIMMQCENPHQQRKAFCHLNSKLYSKMKQSYIEVQSKIMSELRQGECDEKRQMRIEKWRLSIQQKSEEDVRRWRGVGVPSGRKGQKYEKIICDNCGKSVASHFLERHKKKCMRPAVSFRMCLSCGVRITKRHKCKGGNNEIQ